MLWRTGLWAALLMLASLSAAQATGLPFVQRPQVRAYIQHLVSNDHFDQAYLERLFAAAEPQPAVIAAMERPAEALPWYQYRPIFLTAKRIREGVAFWHHHRVALARAEKAYGVPPQVVTAIIGVESFYGRRMGHFPVFATLATLGFDYPPREHFFQKQLTQFLLLMRKERISPLKPKGSYAGAMGQGQFMPGSYRAYAVDFDGNGHRDLWNDPVDAIGSVANYLDQNGWQHGGMVATRAQVGNSNIVDSSGKLKPTLTRATLADAGVTAARTLRSGQHYAVVRLQTGHGSEFWVTGHNFYVIMRYNASALYAMAVYQLSVAIREAYQYQTKATHIADRRAP